jgi:hypothetical protein
MSERDHTLITDWEARLRANALALRILLALNDRKSELQRCALDGLQRENPQFARAASPEFRKEAIGHCDAIIELMLAIAQARAAQLGPEPFDFVRAHGRRRARQQFPLAGSLNAYRLAHKGYWETIRNSVEVVDAIESEKTDCLMVLSEFLLEFFDRISGIMTDSHIAEEKQLIARGARARRSSRTSCTAGNPAISIRRRFATARGSATASPWRWSSDAWAGARTAMRSIPSSSSNLWPNFFTARSNRQVLRV